MFPLRDRTRRWICRTIFIIVGVVPTVSIIACCAAMNSPTHIADVREQFANVVGLDLHFEKFSRPRPGAVLLDGLELADPETGESLAHIRQLEMRSDASCPVWLISQADINAAKIDWLLALVRKRLQLGIDRHDPALRVSVTELTFRSPDGAQTFVDGNFQFGSVETGRSFAAVMRSASVPAAAPIQLHVVRSLDASGALGTIVDFDCAETPLPCSLLSTLADLENHLGSKSTWSGTMKLSVTARRWRGEFKGKLNEVDLQAAVNNQISPQMNGWAEIDINHMVLQNGRIESCDGSLQCRDGSVSGSLVLAAKEFMKLRPATFSGPMEQLFAFNELHFNFSIDPTGLSVLGRCGNNDSDIIMRSQNGIMLANSSRVRVSTAALVNMLVPDSRLLLPATRQARWLAEILPMPGDR
jgi:hypothetical protein